MAREPFVSGLPGNPAECPSIKDSLDSIQKIIDKRRRKRLYFDTRRTEGTKEAEELTGVHS